MRTTISDTYGDRVEVYERASGGVYVDCFEDTDREAQFAFDAPQTQELIDALAENAGLGVAPQSAPAGAVRASDISYNEAVLRLACAHNRTVSFSYAKGAGNVIETRRLEPDALREVTQKGESHLTFSGYDPDRDEPRAYRLDRIKGEVRL